MEVMAPPFRLALVEDRDGTDGVMVMVIFPPLNGSGEYLGMVMVNGDGTTFEGW